MLREVKINDAEWRRKPAEERAAYINAREKAWLERLRKGDGVYLTGQIGERRWSSAVMLDSIRICLTYDSAKKAAKILGARLPTVNEAIGDLARMRHIDPVVIRPVDPISKAKGIWTSESDKAIAMHSETIGEHDDLIDNDGKVWCDGCVNYGLIDPDHEKGRWQGPGTKHNGKHVDCTQTLRVVWDDIYSDIDDDTDPPATSVAPANGALEWAKDFLTDIQFTPAKSFTKGRPLPIIGICTHTAQIKEVLTASESLAKWANTSAPVSWHFAVDADSIVQSVKLQDTAYACPGLNHFMWHIELSGYAEQSDSQWHDDYSRRTLDQWARLCAALMIYGGWDHAVKGTAEDIIDMTPGIIVGHVDGSEALRLARKRGLQGFPWWTPNKGWRTSSHVDPGKNFPWAEGIERINQLMKGQIHA